MQLIANAEITPTSINLCYPSTFSRNICGLHRRLLDGSTRQLTSLTLTAPLIGSAATPAGGSSLPSTACISPQSTTVTTTVLDHDVGRAADCQCSPICDHASGVGTNNIDQSSNSSASISITTSTTTTTTTANTGIVGGGGSSSIHGLTAPSSLALRRPSANMLVPLLLFCAYLSLYVSLCPVLLCPVPSTNKTVTCSSESL